MKPVKGMRSRLLGIVGTVVLGAVAAAGCGSAAQSSGGGASTPAKPAAKVSSSTAGGGSAAAPAPAPSSSSSSSSSSPLKGKTIRLIVAGSPGGSHDLFARVLGPALSKALGTTVDVLDMPGGGGLKGWNYTSEAKPDGLTLVIGNLEGEVANYWEKVPGQNFNVAKETWLGGMAGNRGLEMYVLFSNKKTPPFDTAAHVIKTKQQLTELGALGDVTGPLWFKMYNLNGRDLTSYASSGAEKAGLLRGDGQFDIKMYGNWRSLVTTGKLGALLAYTLRPKWNAVPSVPTLGAFMKEYPPVNSGVAVAERADVTALDAGVGIEGPAGIPSNISSALSNAIAAAFQNPSFKSRIVKARLTSVFESPAQEYAAIKVGLQPKTVALMRKYVPMSQGVAS